MDVSDLRKRILRALDDGQLDGAQKRGQRLDEVSKSVQDLDEVSKRSERDEAQRAYEQFLSNIAVPLLRQAQGILKAEAQLYTVHAPAGSAKLASDRSPQTFLEFVLESADSRPSVIGRTSRAKGRQRVVVEERPVATGKPVAGLTDEDVAAFLVAELPKLVAR